MGKFTVVDLSTLESKPKTVILGWEVYGRGAFQGKLFRAYDKQKREEERAEQRCGPLYRLVSIRSMGSHHVINYDRLP